MSGEYRVESGTSCAASVNLLGLDRFLNLVLIYWRFGERGWVQCRVGDWGVMGKGVSRLPDFLILT